MNTKQIWYNVPEYIAHTTKSLIQTHWINHNALSALLLIFWAYTIFLLNFSHYLAILCSLFIELHIHNLELIRLLEFTVSRRAAIYIGGGAKVNNDFWLADIFVSLQAHWKDLYIYAGKFSFSLARQIVSTHK